MNQRSQLIKSLKGILKKEGKTYSEIAESLRVSEATVKRIFTTKDISLERLESICNLLDIEISDLVLEMQQANTETLTELTYDQESLIAKNIELLLITVLVLNRWSLKEIIQHYKFEEHECLLHLIQLDKLKIIDLQVNNRIKLLISPHFKWRDNGPIQQFFRAKIEKEYFQSNFTNHSEHLTALNIMLSEKSNQYFQRKLEKLAHEFNEVSKEESNLAIGDRKGSTVILAIRDWDYSELYGLYRVAKDKS